MTTAAQLGLQVVYDTVDRARTNLDRLVASARSAEAATRRLGEAPTRALNSLQSSGGRASQSLASLQQRAESATRQIASGMDRSRRQAEGAVRQIGLARHELINLGRQAQDVGTMLAMGASPLSILASQGAQVVDIFSSTRSSMADVRAQLLSFITLRRVAFAGVGVGAAVGIGGALYWKNYALALDDTARAADIATRAMSSLQAAASFKGIGQDDFAASMGKFAASVYEARNGMGSLATLMRANGRAATDFESTLDNVADLVKRAAGDTQLQFSLIRQAGLPATMEWLRLLERGADGMRKMRGDASAFGGAVNDQMVARARQFDEALNRGWTNFGIAARSAVVVAMGELDKLNGWLERSGFNQFMRDYHPLAQVSKGLGMPGADIGVQPDAAKQAAAQIAAQRAELQRLFELREKYFDRAKEVHETMKMDPAGDSPTYRASYMREIDGYLKQAAEVESKMAALRGGISESGRTRVNVGGNAKVIDPEVQKKHINWAQEYIGLLGDMATSEERVEQTTLRIMEGRTRGIELSDRQRDALINMVRAQEEAQRIQERARLGIFDTSQAYANLQREMRAAIDRGLVDPSNPQQMAAAYNVYSRALRDTADAARVAGSAMPELARYAVEAGNYARQLDQVAVSGLRGMENALVDLAMGTKSVSEAFKSMANSIISDLIRMMTRMYITGPIAGMLQGMLPGMGGMTTAGMGMPGGGVLPAGLYHVGGTAGAPDAMRWVHAAHFNDAPRYHRGGLVGDEVPAILKPGEVVFQSVRHAQQAMGGHQRSAPAQITVNLNEAPPGARVEQSQDENGNPRIDIAWDKASAGNMRPGSRMANATLGLFGARQPPRRRGA